MVKPGMAYLDIVRQTKDKVHNEQLVLIFLTLLHSGLILISDISFPCMLISFGNLVRYH